MSGRAGSRSWKAAMDAPLACEKPMMSSASLMGVRGVMGESQPMLAPTSRDPSYV
jgi:hypothetical protein